MIDVKGRAEARVSIRKLPERSPNSLQIERSPKS